MGLKPADFYRMTWREYVLTCRGFAIKRSHAFEHTRAVVYNNAALNRDPKKAFPTIEKFWPLPTDDADAGESDMENEGKRLHDKLQHFIKNKMHK